MDKTLALKDTSAVRSRPDTTGALMQKIRLSPVTALLSYDRKLTLVLDGKPPRTRWERLREGRAELVPLVVDGDSRRVATSPVVRGGHGNAFDGPGGCPKHGPEPAGGNAADSGALGPGRSGPDLLMAVQTESDRGSCQPRTSGSWARSNPRSTSRVVPSFPHAARGARGDASK